MNILSALVGGSHICVDCDLHAYETSNDRGEPSDQEGNGSVELTKFDFGYAGDQYGEED